MKNWLGRVGTVVAVGGLFACSSGPSMRVEDALLAKVPPGAMQGVIDARAKRDQAADAVSKAEIDITKAKNAADLVKSELKIAESEVEQAGLKVDIAKQQGNAEAIQDAEAEAAIKRATVDVKKKLLNLRLRQIEQAEARLVLAKILLEKAQAEVELAKAKAVQGLDDPRAKEISVSRFELQVTEYKSKVAKAEEEVAAVGVEVEEAQKIYDEAKQRLDAMTAPAATVPGGADY